MKEKKYLNIANRSLIVLGIVLRLKHYFENRSFWVDEAWLAIEIINRSWKEMFQQIAIFPDVATPPLGFVIIQKVMITFFGSSEMALRLVPLIAGIASIFLFYALVKRYVSGWAVFFALAIFILGEPFVYYAAELKRYSLDVFMTCFLYLQVENIRRDGFSWKNCAILGITGALFLWFSHALIFILTGAGAVFAWRFIVCKDRKTMGKIGLISLFWMISFFLLYRFYLTPLMGNSSLSQMWSPHFMPQPFWSLEAMRWVKESFYGMFENPLGLKLYFWTTILFFLGCFTFFRRDPEGFFMFFLPFVLLLILTGLRIYPFKGRMLFFFLPGALIFLAQGIYFLKSLNLRIVNVVAAVVMVLLLWHPLKTAAYYVQNPHCNQVHHVCQEEMRDVMEFFDQYYEPGDAVFINSSAQFPYWYYLGKMNVSKKFQMEPLGSYKGEVIKGFKIGNFRDASAHYLGREFFLLRYRYDVFNQQGYFQRSLAMGPSAQPQVLHQDSPAFLKPSQRVWLIFSHCEPEVIELIKGYFEKHARNLKEYQSPGAYIYLYQEGS